ncbi:hypothetical protein D3C76_1653650 [compost metagenome]
MVDIRIIKHRMPVTPDEPGGISLCLSHYLHHFSICMNIQQELECWGVNRIFHYSMVDKILTFCKVGIAENDYLTIRQFATSRRGGYAAEQMK